MMPIRRRPYVLALALAAHAATSSCSDTASSTAAASSQPEPTFGRHKYRSRPAKSEEEKASSQGDEVGRSGTRFRPPWSRDAGPTKDTEEATTAMTEAPAETEGTKHVAADAASSKEDGGIERTRESDAPATSGGKEARPWFRSRKKLPSGTSVRVEDGKQEVISDETPAPTAATDEVTIAGSMDELLRKEPSDDEKSSIAAALDLTPTSDSTMEAADAVGIGDATSEKEAADDSDEVSTADFDAEEETMSKQVSRASADAEEKDETAATASNYTSVSRPTVVYFTGPPGAGVRPGSPPHHHHPGRQPPPSSSGGFLGAILSALVKGVASPGGGSADRPPAFFPGDPASMPPPPGGGPSATASLISLLLRLALLSILTSPGGLFGFGGMHDAYSPSPSQHYMFEKLNDRYVKDGVAITKALTSPPPGIGARRWGRIFRRRKRAWLKELRTREKEATLADSLANAPDVTDDGDVGGHVASGEGGAGTVYDRTVVILDTKPDAKLSNGEGEMLRDVVSFLIEQHRDLLKTRPAMGSELEVVLLLESPGGTVQDYGLASSHVARLRNEPGVVLTVCVDRVAASGGYMMACQASPGRLFAAPFAVVGSLGVLMEAVNVNDLLRRWGVKPLKIKAGSAKAPVSTFGEVTKSDVDLVQKDLNSVHLAFKRMVAESRPGIVDSRAWKDRVCAGEVFLGTEAHDLGLVDRIITSDEYVSERIAAGDRVLRLHKYDKSKFGLKLSPLDLLLLKGSKSSGWAWLGPWRRLASTIGPNVVAMARAGGTIGLLSMMQNLFLAKGIARRDI